MKLWVLFYGTCFREQNSSFEQSVTCQTFGMFLIYLMYYAKQVFLGEYEVSKKVSCHCTIIRLHNWGAVQCSISDSWYTALYNWYTALYISIAAKTSENVLNFWITIISNIYTSIANWNAIIALVCVTRAFLQFSHVLY